MTDIFNAFLSHKEDLLAIGAGIVAIASAAANIFPKATILGKIVHFFALNFTTHK